MAARVRSWSLTLAVALIACGDEKPTSPLTTVLPTDRRIVFSSARDGNLDIFIMDADGTNGVRLTSHRASDRYPFWSPDGLRIAFTSDRDGDDEIYVMNADGTELTRLTNSPGQDVLNSWR